jgi:hypothetical protein
MLFAVVLGTMFVLGGSTAKAVQCEDGWFSPSDGGSGTCSWHGGVKDTAYSQGSTKSTWDNFRTFETKYRDTIAILLFIVFGTIFLFVWLNEAPKSFFLCLLVVATGAGFLVPRHLDKRENAKRLVVAEKVTEDEKTLKYLESLTLPSRVINGECVKFHTATEVKVVRCGEEHDGVVSASYDAVRRPDCGGVYVLGGTMWDADDVPSLEGVPYYTEPLWFRDWSLKNYSTDKYGKHYLWTWPFGDTYRDIENGEYRGEVQCLSIIIKEDTSWYGGHWGVGPVADGSCLGAPYGELERVACEGPYSYKVDVEELRSGSAPCYGLREYFNSLDGSPEVLCVR